MEKIKFNKISKTLPKSPGVYQFTDKNGDVLYIGKAKNLFNRVKSYFVKEIGRGPSIDIMVGAATNIKHIVTESEIEAILLEAELIKKLKPKYNARLKDDKSFLVIKITKKKLISKLSGAQSNIKKNFQELYPCVELVRAKNVDFSDKSAEYFGPYPSGDLLRRSINFLRKIFPYRDCSKTKFSTYCKKGRPCIYGDIRVCTAPCVEWVTVEQYNKNILYLKSFLRGRKQEIYKKLQSEMQKLSKAKRFEEASLIRDKIGAIDHLKDVAVGLKDESFDSNKLLFKRIECFDISNISQQHAVGSMVVFIDGKPEKSEYRKFKIKYKSSEGNFVKECNGKSDLSMMKEMLERRFKNDWPMPDLIVVDGGETHLSLVKDVLKNNKINIPLISIAKGAKRAKNEFHFGDESIAKYFHKNSYIQNIAISARDEAHRFAISYYRLLHTKDMLK